ncbi:MAG: hypothetical protein A3J63_03740 [Candidatus Moranbacteria bacterium RIFCSPHIGHO2_02_FULL_40_12b]|nr:MAG: hypothetical protein A3J63_03740 [Candidatus Moranbacteria bacterium RIFCSPHIGHO2_02_FULL_40_12b]OGI23058.1 MAG: hypothetical protein A3E91_02795 [Candidatus Moranbacteria bacterium RIFCSPHIGHO2_12_FULL_40_10]
MKKLISFFVMTVISFFVTVIGYAGDSNLAEKIDAVISKGPEYNNFFVVSENIRNWIQQGKSDFIVVDVRFGEEGKKSYDSGHIPGAIYISYEKLFKPENLKKLPSNKKIILVCHMGASEILPLIPLRMLGYDAYAMLMGMSAWQKDYPAAEFMNKLIEETKTKNYPLEGGKK